MPRHKTEAVAIKDKLIVNMVSPLDCIQMNSFLTDLSVSIAFIGR
jgi:hypothetical protein